MEVWWTLARQILTTFLVIILTSFLFRIIIRFLRRTVHLWQSQFTEFSASRRRLGRFEEIMEIHSNERQGSTNSCYVMTLRSKIKLEESRVREALLCLVKKQPVLRAVIKTVSNSYWFRRHNEKYFEIVDPSKVGDMIDLATLDVYASQWQELWYDIVMRPVKSGLLWKAVLFKEEYLPQSENYMNTVIFKVHHCIIDGISGMKLCKQFLSNLNGDFENSPVRKQDTPSLELLPSFYEMMRNSQSKTLWNDVAECLGLHFILKLIARLKLGILSVNKHEKTYRFLMEKPLLEVHDLAYKLFSEEETSQICKVCRSKGATVTAALVTVSHTAFCKLFGNFISTKQQNLTHIFALSGLRVCKPKPPVEYLGNYLLSEVLSTPSKDDEFWSIAQEVTKKIQQIVTEGKYVSEKLAEFDVFTPKEIVEQESPLDTEKKKKLLVESYVSSAGAFAFDDDTFMYKQHECLYYSIPYAFASLSSHFNTTVNGKMSWVILCNKLVPRALEEQFSELCFNILLEETHLK